MTEKLKGAEATVKISDSEVEKQRKQKKYRHPEIDNRIRDERTEMEKKLMQEARQHNVNVPETEKKDKHSLKIQKIDGQPLKQVVNQKTEQVRQLGEQVALLHSINIIHGDLTTSNVIIEKETEKPFLIDFGLAFRSERAEDKAVDIHLFKQVLESSHPEKAGKAWKQFLDGYREYSEAEKVLEQLKEVEKRGRYK
ncbi:MAG: KEOPS complex kinase/ATPase Bud32 [Candidatus Nanohaloarchaea archaeon]